MVFLMSGAPCQASSVAAAASTMRTTPGQGAMPVSLSHYPTLLWDDLGGLVTAPVHFGRRDWEAAALGVALVGAVRTQDATLRRDVRGTNNDARGLQFANDFRPYSQYGSIALPIAGWIAGAAFDHPRLEAISQDGLESIVLAAGVVTPVLKVAFGRERPRQGGGPDAWFQGGASFPSGEVTEVAALAGALVSHDHSLPVQALAWGMVGATGWERMRLDAHWASDFVAAGLLGGMVGHWVAARHRPDAAEDGAAAESSRHGALAASPDAPVRHRLLIEPVVLAPTPGARGLGLRIDF
jgi:hypothetical protein